jgi:hypothetical protein
MSGRWLHEKILEPRDGGVSIKRTLNVALSCLWQLLLHLVESDALLVVRGYLPFSQAASPVRPNNDAGPASHIAVQSISGW